MGRTVLNVAKDNREQIFQLTRPVWGEPEVCDEYIAKGKISTHSPRVGRTLYWQRSEQSAQISTHSPRVGRTDLQIVSSEKGTYFNSLAPCGANRITPKAKKQTPEFQLTRPVWGEPLDYGLDMFAHYISTHSPRVGRTHNRTCNRLRFSHFNSLAPCGANQDLPV